MHIAGIRVPGKLQGRSRERPQQLRVDVEDQTVEGYQPLKNPKYEVYIDAGGKTRFRLKASNGEIIAASQAYADKQSCLKGIRSIASHAPDAEIVVVEAEGEDGS